ncbi:Oidioi.mRNA.OKI2018_I69.PAR.g9569.t1.cds [Oikopleura dioica]|uniref:Oidioi.mRNA.OKI2018_I69.PAR.g9569.t1.cds n=1 Tax=Oikopleura dioica TaxID=34765 RepID=A0ABN7RPY1_OIKDI|nr:Oidioi.mRNA.OKI2018_I69.PAR.g9569.t1.cds [Oikopleura dioica]
MVEGDPPTGRDDSLFNSSQVVRRKPQTPKTNDAVVFNIQKESVQYQAGYQATSRRKSAAGSDEIIHVDGKTSAQLTPERRKIRRSSSGSSEIYHLRRTPSVSSVASISEDVPRVSWNRVLTSIRHGQSLSISAVTDKIVDHDVTAFWHVEIATNMAKYQRWKGEIIVPTGHKRGQTTISLGFTNS